VHLSSNGFPIVGDDKYGDFSLNKELQRAEGDRPAFKRMFLHAHKLTFSHPESGKPVTLSAALPGECVALLQGLERATA
jgi:23S rRNA pseudouridine955/2504/2580 synthase